MRNKPRGIGYLLPLVIVIVVAGISIATVVVMTRPSAKFEVTSFTLSSTEASVGASTTGNITVKNVGNAEGTYHLVVKLNGAEEYTQEVTLQPGEEKEIPITITWNEAGTHTLETGGLSRTVTVRTLLPATFEVSNLEISPTEVEPGDIALVLVNVKNKGEVSGTYTVTLKIDGTTENTRDVTLGGGENTTIGFIVEKYEAKTYNVSVDGLTGTFSIISPPVIVGSRLIRNPTGFSYYGEGYDFILGEIQNPSTSNVADVNLVLTLYNKYGNMIKTITSPYITWDYSIGKWWGPSPAQVPKIPILTPGQKIPFGFKIEIDALPEPYLPSDIDYYELEVNNWESTSKEPYRQFTITENQIHPWAENSEVLLLEGKVKNIGGEKALDVFVCATFYDENGEIIGYQHCYTEPLDLNPNEEGNFTLFYWSPITKGDPYIYNKPWEYEKLSSYTIQVFCWNVSD